MKNNFKSVAIAFVFILIVVCFFTLFYFHKENVNNNPQKVISRFFKNIAAQKYDKCIDDLIQSGDVKFKVPTTELGKVVYRNIRIVSVENIQYLSKTECSADVTLQILDTTQIMNRAAVEYLNSHRIAKTAQPDIVATDDQLMNEIYSGILQDENLPKKEQLCILSLRKTNGKWKIVLNQEFENILEGNVSNISKSINEMFGK